MGLFAVLSLCVACSEPLPAVSTVDKLRLFGLMSPTPEIPVGTGAAVKAAWFDGKNSARTVFFTWKICSRSRTADARACLHPAAGHLLAQGEAMHDEISIPAEEFLESGSTDALPAVYFVVVAMCPDAPAVFDDATLGFICPFEAMLPQEAREGIQGFRTITVRSDAVFNHNPTLASIHVGSADLAAAPLVLRACQPDAGTCAPLAITATATDDSSEVVDAVTREVLLMSVFSTRGRFDNPRAVASMTDPLGRDGSLRVNWTPPSSPGPVIFWIALRDGRGGETVRSFSGLVVRGE